MSGASLHIVSGPTSAGKSAFIEAHRDDYDEVVLPGSVSSVEIEAGRRYVLHYNLLRPLGRMDNLRHQRSIRARVRAARLARRVDVHGLYERDPLVARIEALPTDKRATILVVGRGELESRIAGRDYPEPLRGASEPYPNERWLTVLAGVDLEEVYLAWMSYLDARAIPFELMTASEGRFEPLDAAGLSAALRAGDAS